MENNADRRARIVEEMISATGIDECLISLLVSTFYARIRQHAVLGPIFNRHVSNWEEHLAQMQLFWSSVMLMSGQYHGRPMLKHLDLPIDARHFDQWLGLFQSVAHEVCSPAVAKRFIDCAQRIAGSLECGVAAKNEVILGRGERYINAELICK